MLAFINTNIRNAKTRDEAWAAILPTINALANPAHRKDALAHAESVIAIWFPAEVLP